MELFLAILSSSAVATIVSSIINRIDKKDNLSKAVQLLMLGEIKLQGKDYLSIGEINLEELQAFNECYQVYKKLGGNGYAETIHSKVNALPIRKDVV